jgi:His/Glu/Gln/Arg/opine family amino acid ABC transporter permease subunit
MGVLGIIKEYSWAFATGLGVTLRLTGIVWTVGLVLGSVLGVAGAWRKRSVGRLVSVGSFMLSGLPIMVLLFWLHYPLQAMLEVVIDPFITAAFALSLVNTLGTAQSVCNALSEFPSQYVMAARVAGLTPHQTLLHIKAPILLRQILPTLLTSQVTMLQATLFASLISVDEIFRVAQRINATIYRPVEIYSALGVFFLLVCLPLNGLALWLKERFTRNLSEA